LQVKPRQREDAPDAIWSFLLQPYFNPLPQCILQSAGPKTRVDLETT
jgi:hypothetical protein